MVRLHRRSRRESALLLTGLLASCAEAGGAEESIEMGERPTATAGASGAASEAGNAGGAIAKPDPAAQPTGGDGGVAPHEPDANPVPGRLLVVSFPYAFAPEPFRPTFSSPPPGGGEAWQRSLVEEVLAWHSPLDALADLADEVTIIDSLTLFTAHRQSGGEVDGSREGGAGLLTGRFANRGNRLRGPSIDWLIAEANTPPGGVSIVAPKVLLPLTLAPQSPHPDAPSDAAALHAQLFANADATCQPQPPPSATKPSADNRLGEWMDRMTPIVADALACDRTRVFHLPLGYPKPEEFGAPASDDFHHDYWDTYETDEGRAVVLAYLRLVVDKTAELAHALRDRSLGDGSNLLDHTLIMLLSREGNMRHRSDNWRVVLLGGRALGVQPGRYLHPADAIDTFYGPSGPPHNQLLVSVGRLFGLDIDGIGERAFLRGAIDATGPLPGF